MTNELATLEPEGGAIMLPPSYIAARIALAKCERIDECQEWSSKAAALSSYAQQARDDALLVLADRIRARAVRRCGELLKEIPPTQSRSASARAAGLTVLQKAQSINVANVPKEIFEHMVESEKPPKISRLARIGRKPRECEHASPLSIRKFARYCAGNPARSMARKTASAKPLVEAIAAWCQEFLK